ncbi:MAG: TatD family hydrolase [Dehalococcoidia bacterium]
MHAHVAVTINPADLAALNAVIFAVTRSLEEADQALQRRDDLTIWGTGCHPGLVRAHQAFSSDRFCQQVELTPYVGELGLDGKSRVPMSLQQSTLRAALEALSVRPRITSLHSYAATAELIAMLEHHRPVGAVLHWWLGTEQETRRAIELGCYFSINSSSCRRRDLLRIIPLDRLLTETDHPFGDRSHRGVSKPGNVSDVEEVIANVHSLSSVECRLTMWRNLYVLITTLGIGSLFSPKIRALLASA